MNPPVDRRSRLHEIRYETHAETSGQCPPRRRGRRLLIVAAAGDTRVKFVWGMGGGETILRLSLCDGDGGAYNNIILLYTSEYKHFHFAKKVRWLAAIRALVRARVCVRSSSPLPPSTLHNGWQGCFFFCFFFFFFFFFFCCFSFMVKLELKLIVLLCVPFCTS